MKNNNAFGFGSINFLEEILKKVNPSGVFLVRGKKSFSLSGAKKYLDIILKKYSLISFTDFTENPQIEDLKKAIKIFKESKCDIIIAAGGGSVMDMAKLIRFFSAIESDVEDYVLSNSKEKPTQNLPLVTIPTTSGSGSEVTHFAVLYIDQKKHSVADESIRPDYYIVDPELSMSVTPHLTAASGMDALCQGIESFWSVNSTDLSKKYSEEAIELVIGNLEIAVNNPNRKSRANMAKAALLAGKAIDATKTTLCHALSYPFTTYFGVKHGHAVALTMGEAIMLNSNIKKENCNDSRGYAYVKENMNKLFALLGCKSAEEAKGKINNLMSEVGLLLKLSELGLKNNDIDLIANNVNIERLKNNPVQLSEKDIYTVLNNIY